jgi:tripartite-type tricarboxylate transporter receptor subunit TctC
MAGAHAQSYPARPVSIVVGFTAGGSTDIVTRLVAEDLRKSWGQSVIVENRPGAGGNIGAAYVAKANPDGYTLLMSSAGPLAINASLYSNLPYDHLRDFTPVTLVVHVPLVLVVNPRAVPATTFKEFLAEVRANPGKFFFASTGSGTASHLAGELLKVLAGLDMTHVPYKGAVALNDVFSGESVQCMFATIPSVMGHIRSGTLRALAVTTAKRTAALPDLPTIAESGYPDFEASSWFGLVGPRGLPGEVVVRLQTDIARILAQPEMRSKLTQQGVDPVGSSPEAFGAYMRAETAKWAKLVKSAGAKAD